MFRRILVPLDGSRFAEAALPAAVTLARRSPGEIRLLSVHELLPAYAVSDLDEAARIWAEGYVGEVEGRVSPRVGGCVSTAVREGAVVDGIKREAESWHADLIVMATHGRGAVSRAWLGSVADGTLRHAHRPVLMVRPEEPRHEPDLDAEMKVPRIVVPLDGSPLAEQALDDASVLARLTGARVSLVRAVAYPIGPMSPYLPHTIEINRQIVDEARADAARYLDETAERLRKRDVTVDTAVVSDQHPAHAILEHAEGDLIAMATHGRGGIGRALLGSVADKVIRGASGPVLALPYRKPEPAVP